MAESMVSANELFELSSYLIQVSRRADTLSLSAEKLDNEITAMADSVTRKSMRYNSLIAGLKEEVSGLEEEVRFLQTNILLVIGQMKNILKKEDFQRFERRVDLWAPEAKLSRDEALRVIQRIS